MWLLYEHRFCTEARPYPKTSDELVDNGCLSSITRPANYFGWDVGVKSLPKSNPPAVAPNFPSPNEHQNCNLLSLCELHSLCRLCYNNYLITFIAYPSISTLRIRKHIDARSTKSLTGQLCVYHPAYHKSHTCIYPGQ